MDYTNLKERMEKSIGAFKEKLSEIRAGRANPAILNKVKIDYYGTPTPINQVGSISVPEPRTLLINPWDKSAMKDIEKAIMNSDLGLNPTNDGDVIRLNIPALTEERRIELTKQAKKASEEFKVRIRNERRDANDKLKKMQKDGEITEDELKRGQDDVQKLTDKYNTSVMPINCANLTINDINTMFSKILYEFPAQKIAIKLPRWVDGLSFNHPIKVELFNEIKDAFSNANVLKDISSCTQKIGQTEMVSRSTITNIELGSGNVKIQIDVKEDLFYKVLSEITGVNVENEGDLFGIITDLSSAKKKYDKIAYALEEVNAKGYGIVTPSIDDLVLAEPEMVKQGSRFGVKLKATAPSLHIIRPKQILFLSTSLISKPRWKFIFSLT